MPRCTKDEDIELSDGTIVETHIMVNGMFDDLFNVATEGRDAPGAWIVESWKSKHSEELDEDQQQELDERVEEIVFAETWDFENASEADEDEDEEDDE